jgi:alpha-mannosidase
LAVTVDLAGTGVMTVCADPAGASRERGGSPAPPREPAQPVFTRYWLHNRGSAPIGNLPVAVHVSPPKIRLADGVPARVRVTVAASGRPAAGLVELAVPDGLAITAGGDGGGPHGPEAAPRLEYDLAPGEHVAYDLDVAIAPGGGFGGSAYLAARIRDELGQVLEDATAVVVEPAERADSAGGTDSAGSAVGAEPATAAEPVEVTVEPASLELSPGGAGEIVVRLANRTRGAVRGEAQLVSPIGTWGPAAGASITPWTQGFEVASGAETELRFRVRVPGESRPGAHWWALVKVACFGRLHYTPTIPIEIR